MCCHSWVAQYPYSQLSVQLNPYFCAPASLLVIVTSLKFFKGPGISYWGSGLSQAFSSPSEDESGVLDSGSLLRAVSIKMESILEPKVQIPARLTSSLSSLAVEVLFLFWEIYPWSVKPRQYKTYMHERRFRYFNLLFQEVYFHLHF